MSVATITLARDSEEEGLLRAAMTALDALGWPVHVADGGSREDFTQFLRRLRRVTVNVPAAHGLVGQIRASLSGCAQLGTRFILYTESDKQAFFEQHLLSFVDQAPLDDHVGIVMASRSAAAFATFPPFQRSTEAAINRLCGEIVGQDGDYLYGPCLLHRDLVPYVDRVNTELGWGWRPFIFAVSHRLGRRIVHLTGDFDCPMDQRGEGEAERVHRLRQLGQNASGLALGLTTPL